MVPRQLFDYEVWYEKYLNYLFEILTLDYCSNSAEATQLMSKYAIDIRDAARRVVTCEKLAFWIIDKETRP